MLLNTKKLTFLGLLLAVTILLIVLGGVFEANTLFLLSGASFCVGIAFRESGIRFAVGFYIASIILSFFLAPFYWITYGAMGLYILIAEYSYDKVVNTEKTGYRRPLLWLVKYVIFNMMYIPALLFLPKLIYQGDLNSLLVAILLVAGQVALFIYDIAYQYFQRYVWGKIRNYLKLN